jgi:hypothetical protein
MSIRPQIQTVVHVHTKSERQAGRRQHREAKKQHRVLTDRIGAGSPALLVSDRANPDGFVTRSGSVWVRMLAHLWAASLDRQLASGLPPESNRLTAARAQALVSLPLRRSLVSNWEDLAARATNMPVARDPRVSLCRDRIVARDDKILVMIRALSTTLPVPAQGVAMANWLLSDGAGPLYNRSSTTDLSDVLDRVIELLDPAAMLAT